MRAPPTQGSSQTRRVLRVRDRAAILTGIAGLTALSWLYLIDMARDMQGGSMRVLGLHPWTPAHFGMMFAMWAIMMVGMMLPSATPATLVYSAVARKAERDRMPVASVGAFVAGYLLMWTVFSLAATAAQWGLERAALLSPMMVSSSPVLGATLLVSAGIYQLTPFKETCLEHCRSPAHFIAERWRTGFLGALRMGIDHGAYCLGCCWVLMGLLFFGGVMNLLWIAAITLFVLLEKLFPYGAGGGRWAGVGMIAAGALVLIGDWSAAS
jgi:predicted metal-binding membrane protein